MRNWIMLIAGGIIGTVSRYVLAGAVYQWLGTGFPYGTLVVNGSGALIIGFLSALAERKFLIAPEWRLFWMVGMMGAYTTFSTFSWEAFELFSVGNYLHGAFYILASVAGGILGVLGGISLGQLI